MQKQFYIHTYLDYLELTQDSFKSIVNNIQLFVSQNPSKHLLVLFSNNSKVTQDINQPFSKIGKAINPKMDDHVKNTIKNASKQILSVFLSKLLDKYRIKTKILDITDIHAIFKLNKQKSLRLRSKAFFFKKKCFKMM